MNITRNTLKLLLLLGTPLLFIQLQGCAKETDTDDESSTVYVSTENFTSEVLEAGIPVLVDFTATWCVPCREVDPIIDELAVEMEGKFKVFKLDIDTSPEVYQEYNINGIPHILFFRDGEEEERIGSVQTKSTYVEYIDGMIAGRSARDITMDMLERDRFRRHFILSRDLAVVESVVETVPNLFTEKFENGQTPLSLILNKSSVRQNDLITLALSFDPEITTHDLVGLGRCEEFLQAIEDDPGAVNRPDPDGNSVLITAMMRSNRLGENDCTTAVLSADVDLSKHQSSNFSLGRAVILSQDVELLEQFIELGWDADLQDEQGYSALQWAAYYGYADSVLVLLDKGSDSTLQFSDGKTVLDYVMRSYTRSKQSLEDMQADETTDFAEQMTTVQESITKLETVLARLEKKAEINLTTKDSDETM